MFAEAISLESVARGTDTARDGSEALKSSDSALKGRIIMHLYQVKKTAHEQKEIPFFFQKLWAEKKGENPLDNEDRYSLIRSKSTAWILRGFASFLFWSVFGALAEGLHWFHFTLQLPNSVLLSGVGIGVIILGVCEVVCYRTSPDRRKGEWHFEEYYTRLFELFTLFGITPNTEVGQLSKEDFAGMVADSLRGKMGKVDTLKGFARVADYNEFKRMHAAALEWGLCSSDYGKYDPKKV